MVHADPTSEVRPIPGFPGYFAGRDGSVWSFVARFGNGRPRWHRMKEATSSGGYRVVALRPAEERRRGGAVVTRYVHRLVLEAFVGPCPPGMEVCHGNGRPDDNRLENLRYDTKAANAADAMRHGTVRRGPRHWNAKLVEADIPLIRALKARGFSSATIADLFGVTPGNVRRVCRGEAWNHVPS